MVNKSILTSTIVILLYLLVIYSLTITSLPPDFPPHLSSTSSSSRGGGLLTEDKMRLGSRPPSCHNKCNFCHPCMAVQAPTVMSGQMIQAADDDDNYRGNDDDESSGAATEAAVVVSGQLWSFDGGSAGNDRYSNYKPLGWKCRCRNRIYDP